MCLPPGIAVHRSCCRCSDPQDVGFTAGASSERTTGCLHCDAQSCSWNHLAPKRPRRGEACLAPTGPRWWRVNRITRCRRRIAQVFSHSRATTSGSLGQESALAAQLLRTHHPERGRPQPHTRIHHRQPVDVEPGPRKHRPCPRTWLRRGMDLAGAAVAIGCPWQVPRRRPARGLRAPGPIEAVGDLCFQVRVITCRRS